ncbi:MAG: potassium-transporting ATPase subunit C [Pseudonocardiaceae bacterium]
MLGPGNPSVSGGSNLAGDSSDLRDLVTKRRELIAAREGVLPVDVPPDAVTAPASGVDPGRLTRAGPDEHPGGGHWSRG